MPSDRDAKCELCGEPMPPGEQMFKFHGYSGPCPGPMLPRTEPESIVQARAEGFRDGLERAAQWLESRGWMGLVGDVRALAPDQPPAVDLPDSTSAKATDPRGSALPGGGDATEWVPPQGSVGSVVETARRLVHGRAWLRTGEPELVKVDPGTFGALVDAVVALDKKCGA